MRHSRLELLPLAGFTAIAVAHVVLTWGHIEFVWGDTGLWLNEVDRYAHGEVVYRDYYWPFPPMAIWLIGGIARFTGSDTNAVWAVTASIFLLIAVEFFRFACKVLGSRVGPFVAIPAFLLAIAYARSQGQTPLPMGSYTPAAPLGFLFLLAAVNLALGFLQEPRHLKAAGIGFFSGLAILTKQDFWAPAFYLVAICAVIPLWRQTKKEERTAIALVGTLFMTVAWGIGLLVLQSGWRIAFTVLDGAGQGPESVARGWPSWERITIQCATVGVFVLFIYTMAAVGGVTSWRKSWTIPAACALVITGASAVYLTFSVQSQAAIQSLMSGTFDFPGLRAAITFLKRRGQFHLMPVEVPLLAGALLAWKWKRIPQSSTKVTVAILLGLCMAARLRRRFEFTEWFHFLLEIPVYWVLCDLLFFRNSALRRRAGFVALTCLTLFGFYSYRFWGVGPLTRIHMVSADTPRGAVYMSPVAAKAFQELRTAVNMADPSGQYPLFAFGYTGGFNYFLNRPNPTPLTQGFRLSPFSSEDVVRTLQSERVLLLDNSVYEDRSVPAGISFVRWSLPTQPNRYMRYDRPFFLQALSGCRETARIGYAQSYTLILYDCERMRK